MSKRRFNKPFFIAVNDPMPRHKRADRRAHKERLKARTKRIMALGQRTEFVVEILSDLRRVGKNTSTHNRPCSCPMCAVGYHRASPNRLKPPMPRHSEWQREPISIDSDLAWMKDEAARHRSGLFWDHEIELMREEDDRWDRLNGYPYGRDHNALTLDELEERRRQADLAMLEDVFTDEIEEDTEIADIFATHSYIQDNVVVTKHYRQEQLFFAA